MSKIATDCEAIKFKKHKKSIDQPIAINTLTDCLDGLKKTILGLAPRQQNLIVRWLNIWCTYLSFEKTFNPEKLTYYKRGDIINIELGFNIGSEQGGPHYAIVIEKNNSKKSKVITVVPISSIDVEKTKEDLHDSEVYLGEVIPGSNIESYAMPLQMRTISKLRIIKPKKNKDGKIKIGSEFLDSIDEKIVAYFTGQTKNTIEKLK